MRVFLYHTSGCHLCELAEGVIQDAISSTQIKNIPVVEKIDISIDSDLVDAYGLKIPVILIEHSSSTLDWPFSADEVVDYLNS